MFTKLNLQSKMLVSILSVVVIAFVLTIALVSSKANSMAKREAFEKTEQIAFRYSNEVKKKIEATMGTARTLAQTYEGILTSRKHPDRDQLDSALRRIIEKTPGFSGLWVMVDPNPVFESFYSPWLQRKGNNILSEPVTELENYKDDMLDEYYALPKKLKREVVLEPYVDPNIHLPMTTVAVPIIHSDKCFGVVGIDMVLQELTELVKEITPYGTGVASLISNTGKYVAHPDKEKIGKDMGNTDIPAKAREAIKSGKTFTMTTHSKTLNTEVYRIFVPSPIGNTDTPWSFSIEIPMEKILRDARKITHICMITGVISVLLAGLAIYLMSRAIVKPIKTAVSGLKDIAEGEGDLTLRLQVNTRDEIGALATGFNTFMEKLQGIIRRIDENAKAINESSSGLLSVAVRISSGADDTAGRAATVATAAEEMTANLNQVAASMEESSNNTAMVATAAEEMTATIDEITQNARMARRVSDEAVQKTRSASVRMTELGEAARAITKVTEVINDISEQTNLLALNATIEAARAGEAGKGFAVVAGEIKELARQTAQATLNIKNQIEGVQNTTNLTVEEIHEVSTVIEGMNDMIATIAAAVEQQSAATDEIAGNIGKTSRGIEQMNEHIGQCSGGAGEIARDIARVNLEAGDMSKGSGQVSLSAEQLNDMAAQLSAIVGMFKV